MTQTDQTRTPLSCLSAVQLVSFSQTQTVVSPYISCGPLCFLLSSATTVRRTRWWLVWWTAPPPSTPPSPSLPSWDSRPTPTTSAVNKGNAPHAAVALAPTSLWSFGWDVFCFVLFVHNYTDKYIYMLLSSLQQHLSPGQPFWPRRPEHNTGKLWAEVGGSEQHVAGRGWPLEPGDMWPPATPWKGTGHRPARWLAFHYVIQQILLSFFFKWGFFVILSFF